MGISGLFKQCEFELFSDKIHSLLEQKLSRIGIDMYVLLHKFCIDVEIATILVNEPTTFCQPLYEKIKNWLINLINLGFDLYLVYDGTTMKYKVTEEERAMRRAIALAKGDMVGAVEIVPEQMYNLQHFLADLDLPYVVAPFKLILSRLDENHSGYPINDQITITGKNHVHIIVLEHPG